MLFNKKSLLLLSLSLFSATLYSNIAIARNEEGSKFYDGTLTYAPFSKNPSQLKLTCTFPRNKVHPKGLGVSKTIDAPEGFYFENVGHYGSGEGFSLYVGMRSSRIDDSRRFDYYCMYREGEAIIEKASGWTPSHSGVLEDVALENNNVDCPGVAITKNSDKKGVLSDSFVIIKAANQIASSEQTELKVKTMPNQAVVCDADVDGTDCHAREVILEGGKKKLLMVLQRDQDDLFKKGDTVLIDKSDLFYIDRSENLECRAKGQFYLMLSYSNGVKLPAIDVRSVGEDGGDGWANKYWPLRSAYGGKKSDLIVPQKNLRNPQYKNLILIPARTPVRETNAGYELVCASETVLRLGPAPKAIDIPIVKAE